MKIPNEKSIAELIIVMAGAIIMFGSGCKTEEGSVFDSGKSLPDFRAEILSLTLDPGKSQEYSDPVIRYFKYYGLDFRGADHYFGTVVSGTYTIATHVFKKEDSLKTIFLVHGYVLSSFIFNHFIPILLERRYAVVAFDLPGHGLSSGTPGDIGDFSEYGNAIDDILTSVNASIPPPYAIVGHSTGGAAVIEYLDSRKSAFTKHVLVAPLVRSDLYDLSRFGMSMFGWAFSDVPTLVRDSSSNKQFLDFIKNSDPLHPKKVPVSWAKALYAWNERLTATPRTIDADALIIQGDKDVVVEYGYNIDFLKKRIPGTEVRFIAGGKHDLFQEIEPIRNELFDTIIAYLEAPAR